MMMRFNCKFNAMPLAFIVLCCWDPSIAEAQSGSGSSGEPLLQPRIVESTNGTLDISVTLEYATVNAGPFYTLQNTRLLNGTLPGPTLALYPGDVVRIEFHNQLEEQEGTVSNEKNEFSKIDYANLHYHGGHVSGELPSDDVRHTVSPGDKYQYITQFPDTHMPGTHWIHPHVHGSSAMQTAGGAAMALIVKDPPGTLPDQISSATEQILVVHHMKIDDMNLLLDAQNDQKMRIVQNSNPNTSPNDDFRLVNGQYQPQLSIRQNEWQRWRIIMAGWLMNELDFGFSTTADSTCEMVLLARDGIYVRDYPQRKLTKLPIPAGGRADVMVRCTEVGVFDVLDYSGTALLTVEVTSGEVQPTELESWAPTYPPYLSDLRNTNADDGCSCVTKFDFCGGRRDRRENVRERGLQRSSSDDFDDNILNDGPFCINDELFDDSVYIHKVKLGSIVERDIRDSFKHPYHQHVYPVQLISYRGGDGDDVESQYYMPGDWQDVVQLDARDVIVRYHADKHPGLLMLHCHILPHEDRGTMAQELVVEGDDRCSCDRFTISSAPDFNNVPFLIGTAGLLSLAAIVLNWY